MEGDIKSIVSDLLSRYDDLFMDRDRAVDFMVEVFEILNMFFLRGMIPVVVNIMTMSIPRLLFIVSVFNENKVLTMSEQAEVLRLVMGKVLQKGGVDISDDEFSKLFLQSVDEWKEKRDVKKV